MAGSAVKKATEALVRAARNASQDVAFDPNIRQPTSSAVHRMKVALDAQEAINKKERELEEAKRRLKAIRMQFNRPQHRQT